MPEIFTFKKDFDSKLKLLNVLELKQLHKTSGVISKGNKITLFVSSSHLGLYGKWQIMSLFQRLATRGHVWLGL